MSSNFFYRGIKNSTYLTVGNITAQLITLLGFVYITSTLGPEDYGKYSLVVAFVALFGFVSLPGIDRVLLIEGSKNLDTMSMLMSRHFSLKFFFSIFSMLLCLSVSYFMPYSNELSSLYFDI